MRRSWLAFLLIGLLLLPLTVSAKGGGGGFSSGRSGGSFSSPSSGSRSFSAPAPRPSFTPNINRSPSATSVSPRVREAMPPSSRASAVASSSTTVVNQNGGGSSGFMWGMVGYLIGSQAASGGCNRRPDPPKEEK